MSTIQVIENIIRFGGYDVAQIDPNVPAAVRGRFVAELRDPAQAYQEGYDDGYDAGYEESETDANAVSY